MSSHNFQTHFAFIAKTKKPDSDYDHVHTELLLCRFNKTQNSYKYLG